MIWDLNYGRRKKNDISKAHEGKTDLVTRRNLSYIELFARLKNYYSEIMVREILMYAMTIDCWTDGNVAIICTSKEENNCRFVAVANGNYMKIIEP